eukprot:1312483-Rhodomonas_salina.1
MLVSRSHQQPAWCHASASDLSTAMPTLHSAHTSYSRMWSIIKVDANVGRSPHRKPASLICSL